MSRRRLALVLVPAFAVLSLATVGRPLLGGPVLSQDAKLSELQQRVEKLEAAVQLQADAARALRGELAKVEKQGFTAGLNYGSRETLLAALRAMCTSIEQSTTSGRAKARAVPASGRRSRR